jgi:RHS repeat-associated protein
MSSNTNTSVDTLPNIATAIAAAVNADSNLQAIGITAAVVGAAGTVVNIKSVSGNETTYTQSVTGSNPTETITISTTIGGTLANVNNVNTPTSLAPGGPVRIVGSANKALVSATTQVASGPQVNATMNWSQNYTANPVLSSDVNQVTVRGTDAQSSPQTGTGTYQILVPTSASATLTNDANGNMTSDGTNIFLWDAEDCLVKIKYPSGDASVSSPVYVGDHPGNAAITPDGTKAYISNYWSSTVSVIRTSDSTVIATVNVGNYPRGIAITPDGTKVYVAQGNNSGTVAVIKTSDNTVVATVPVGSYPGRIAITPDGSKTYVLNYDTNTVSVIRISDNTVIATVTVGSFPTAIAITPDGTRAYIANGNGTVSVIRTSDNTVIATVTVGGGPWGVAITPDGTKAYIISYSSGKVSVISTSDNTVIATVTVGSNPSGVAVTPDGTKVYVAKVNGTVAVIRTFNNTVKTTVTVGTSPNGVTITPYGNKAYVPNFGAGTVSVINTSTDAVSTTLTVGTSPTLVVVTPDGTQGYALNYDSLSVSPINTTANNSQFTYDGLGRCVKIVETTGGSVTSTKQFVWAGSRIAEERDGSSNVVSQFFPLGQKTSGSNYYYSLDHLGSVREMTDSSGNIVAQYSYDPYGRVTKLQGGSDADFGYAGYYLHQRSGLNLTWFRAYSAGVSRFISRDPIGEAGGANLYAYVGGEPISQSDPTGLSTLPLYPPPADDRLSQCVGECNNPCSGYSRMTLGSAASCLIACMEGQPLPAPEKWPPIVPPATEKELTPQGPIPQQPRPDEIYPGGPKNMPRPLQMDFPDLTVR